jgi:cation transport ATPase
MDEQTKTPLNYETLKHRERSLTLPILAGALCLVQVGWHYEVILSLYFLAPTRWHYLFFDHVMLRLPVYVLVGLPALATCGIAIKVFRRSRLKTARRMQAIVMTLVALSIAVAYLVWLFWEIVGSPADPRAPGYWL